MGLGNTYSAHLMNTIDNPQVFLREVSQSAAASKFISFTKTHGALGLAGNHKDHHLTHDDLEGSEPQSDEDLDNWDESTEEPDSPDDDFNAISLEQLRDKKTTPPTTPLNINSYQDQA